MDLQAFVKSSLEQIALGIVEAKEALSGTDAIVSPAEITVLSVNAQAYGTTRKPSERENPSRIVEKVEFDVAVTVQEGESTSAGIRVSVMSIGLGAGGESNSKSGSQSRIKFNVPMVYPTKKS